MHLVGPVPLYVHAVCVQLQGSSQLPKYKISFQLNGDLDEQVMAVKENHPYIIAAVIDSSSIQLFVVAEKCVLGHTEHVANILIGLIGAYFAFNIVYPEAIYPVLIFIQRYNNNNNNNNIYFLTSRHNILTAAGQYVLGILDRQPIPHVLVRVMSTLDKVTLY